MRAPMSRSGVEAGQVRPEVGEVGRDRQLGVSYDVEAVGLTLVSAPCSEKPGPG